MTINKWLQNATKKLKSASVPTAKLDAEVLLADYLDKDRSWLHAHPDIILPPNSARPDLAKQGLTLQDLDEMIDRRVNHEPLAYIRGNQEFYGRNFMVNKDVLTPRPETEAMIDFLLNFKPKKVIDIGTGSGCIAITAKLELPDSEVYACDISKDCLDVAEKNSNSLKCNVNFYESNLLENINVKQIAGSTLCCNLPYVPDNYNINDAAKHEPKLALFAGKDGLDYYRELFEQLLSLPDKYRPTDILTESLIEQHEDLAIIALQANYDLVTTKDLVQQYRYLK